MVRRRIAHLFAVSGLCAAAQAGGVYYDSNGFETPNFHVGNLAGYTFSSGQDFWVAISPNGSCNPTLNQIVVQSNVVRSGTAAVAIHAAGHSAACDQRIEVYRGQFGNNNERYVIVDLEFASTRAHNPAASGHLLCSKAP